MFENPEIVARRAAQALGNSLKGVDDLDTYFADPRNMRNAQTYLRSMGLLSDDIAAARFVHSVCCHQRVVNTYMSRENSIQFMALGELKRTTPLNEEQTQRYFELQAEALARGKVGEIGPILTRLMALQTNQI